MEKQQDKFASAVDHIIATDSKEDAAWCKKQLDDHPEWVPFLTSLFRRGTFEKMMQRESEKNSVAENEKLYGRLLHTRVKRLDKLPTHVKADFLKTVNTNINTEEWGDELVAKAFMWALMIGPNTPLPEGDVFRHERALIHACQYHYQSQCRKPLHKKFPAKPSPDSFNFFKLVGGGKAKFTPLGATFDLPGGESMEWTISKENSMDCVAVSSKFKGCSQKLLDG